MRKWFVLWLTLGAIGSGFLWLMGKDTSMPGSANPIGAVFQIGAVLWGGLCLLMSML